MLPKYKILLLYLSCKAEIPAGGYFFALLWLNFKGRESSSSRLLLSQSAILEWLTLTSCRWFWSGPSLGDFFGVALRSFFLRLRLDTCFLRCLFCSTSFCCSFTSFSKLLVLFVLSNQSWGEEAQYKYWAHTDDLDSYHRKRGKVWTLSLSHPWKKGRKKA